MGRPVNAQQKIRNHSFEDGPMMPEFQASQHDRIVFLSGDVNEHSISNVITQILSLANINSVAPIHLIVSTYGGSVDEMFSLYDTIKLVKCPVHTVGLGKVMSAGVLLLASGEKGKRLLGKNARIMMHPVSSSAYGNVFEIANETKETERLHNLMVELLIAETSLSKQEIEKIMSAGYDKYITSQEALSMGIVDKII